MNFKLCSTLSDPLELWAAFQTLLQQQPHLHHTQAAQLLGVPEAAIYYAMHQAQPENCLILHPSMQMLLQPIHDWRRLFAVQRNILGVSIHVMHAQSMIETDYIRLFDESQTVSYHTDRCSYVFAARETTHRGHSVSINFFDNEGKVLAKLFLRSKKGQELAWPYWQKQQSVLPTEQLNKLITQRPCKPKPYYNGPAQRALALGIAGLTGLSACSLHLAGAAGQGEFHGEIRHCKTDEHWCHISEPQFRAHFATRYIAKVTLEASSTTSLTAWDGLGGRLRIQVGGAGADQWHDQIAEVLNAKT